MRRRPPLALVLLTLLLTLLLPLLAFAAPAEFHFRAGDQEPPLTLKDGAALTPEGWLRLDGDKAVLPIGPNTVQSVTIPLRK